MCHPPAMSHFMKRWLAEGLHQVNHPTHAPHPVIFTKLHGEVAKPEQVSQHQKKKSERTHRVQGWTGCQHRIEKLHDAWPESIFHETEVSDS